LGRVRVEFHRLLDAAEPNGWRRPTAGTRWNNEQLLVHKFFRDYMTLEDVYRYPGQHFDFHARQLTITPKG
jgi:hypothetical protein